MKIRLTVQKSPSPFIFCSNSMVNSKLTFSVSLMTVNGINMRWFSCDDHIYVKIYVSVCTFMDYYENPP